MVVMVLQGAKQAHFSSRLMMAACTVTFPLRFFINPRDGLFSTRLFKTPKQAGTDSLTNGLVYLTSLGLHLQYQNADVFF